MGRARDTVEQIVESGYKDDDGHITFLMKNGKRCTLHFSPHMLEEIFHTLETLLRPQEPPVPGQPLRGRFMDAIDVHTGLTEDGRILIRFDTRQNATPQVALTMEMGQKLHSLLTTRLAAAPPEDSETPLH